MFNVKAQWYISAYVPLGFMQLNLQCTCLHGIINHSLLVTDTEFLDGNTKYAIDFSSNEEFLRVLANKIVISIIFPLNS